MKKVLVLFLLLPFFTSAQTFTLADTMFKTNAVYRSYRVIFEFDKPIIKKESYAHLDSIADFMFKNLTLIIEVGNHCDTQAPDHYSMNLTQKRADAIVDYLVSKGIAKERLVAKGYHDSKPIIPEEKIDHLKTKNEIENAHKQNRRTEFKIIGFVTTE